MGHHILPFIVPGALVGLGGFVAMLAAGWTEPSDGRADRMWRPYLVGMSGGMLVLIGVVAWAVTA